MAAPRSATGGDRKPCGRSGFERRCRGGAGAPRRTGLTGRRCCGTLLAYKRGEPRVCAMVVAPSSRRGGSAANLSRTTGLDRRAHHACEPDQGSSVRAAISGLRATAARSAARAEALRRGTAELPRTFEDADRPRTRSDRTASGTDRGGRDRAGCHAGGGEKRLQAEEAAPDAVTMLLALKGMGANFAAVLWSEGFYRQFSNRRQVAAYAGLAATPWQAEASGRAGVSKAGNPRLRPR